MTRSLTSRARRRRAACRPRLESLEGRLVLSVAFDSLLGVDSDTGYIVPKDIAVDAAGNTYMTGSLSGTVDFDPGVVRADGSDILTARGYSDVFVAKYTADNTLVWARRMGGDYGVYSFYEIDQGRSIAVDTSGNVYVGGTFAAQGDFGRFTLRSLGDSDFFLTKLDPGGKVLWAKSWGTADSQSGCSIAIDGAGNVVMLGDSVRDLAPGSLALLGTYVRKYNPKGNVVWINYLRVYTPGTVAADAAGNVYVCGQIDGSVDFDPSPSSSYVLTGTAGFVLKLKPTGAFGWVVPFYAEANASIHPADIALDTSGNIAVGGYFSGQVDFDPSDTGTCVLPYTGAYQDGFVARLSPGGSLAWAAPLGGASVRSVAIDATGGVYAAGTFTQTFSPGSGLPPVTTQGREDAFVAGFTASGSLDWAMTYGGPSYDAAFAIAVGPAGTVYITGRTSSPAVDFDPEHPGTAVLLNPAVSAMFLLKLKKR